MQATIIKKSVDWFASQIETVLNPKLSFEISSYIQIYSVQDLFTQEFYKEGKIHYPFVAYRVESIALDETKVGSVINRKKGQTLFDMPTAYEKQYVSGSHKDSVATVDFLPAVVKANFYFVTNTPQQIDEFVVNWIYNYYHDFNGLMSYQDIEIPVSATIDTDITIPEGEVDDKGLVYRLELPITLFTHIGSLRDIPLVQAPGVLQQSPMQNKQGLTINSTIKLTNK